jgi:hypothetical protein
MGVFRLPLFSSASLIKNNFFSGDGGGGGYFLGALNVFFLDLTFLITTYIR